MDRPIKMFCKTCDEFPDDVGITLSKGFIVIECKKCGTAIKLEYSQSD